MISIVARLNVFFRFFSLCQKNTLIAVLCPLLLALQSCSDRLSDNDSIEHRVQEILSSMTLEQKVGQMIQGEIRYMTPQDVKDYSIGSVLNLSLIHI